MIFNKLILKVVNPDINKLNTKKEIGIGLKSNKDINTFFYKLRTISN